jgi:GntR family transcriptional regulator/MocR family aminotransferase
MAFWCRCAPGIDADAWAERALVRGVAVQEGRRFSFDGGPLPFLRLGFGRLDERELREAVRRLAAALTDAGVRQRSRPEARKVSARSRGSASSHDEK